MSNYFKEFVSVYTTSRLVKIHSTWISVLYIILVTLVWCSFLGSLHLDIRKIYQSPCPVRGVVLSKVKGFVSTENLTNEDIGVDNPDLYRRTWDPADIIYPAHGGEGETGSFTIVTNLVITPNQTLGTCAEEFSPASKCLKNSDCQAGNWSASTHGVYTGRCVHDKGTCEIKGWCPIEKGNAPLKEKNKPLLGGVKDFTVMLKNSVEFPECGDQQGRNLPYNSTSDYLKNCAYNKKTDPLCPIFKIGDIVEWSGEDFERVAVKGGVFRIKISWFCDFDFGRTAKDCLPTYEFIRVDDREAGMSTGWNFRSAEFFSEDRRTLKKQYGLKILISLEGEGRRFDFFQLVITLGATIGLFSVAPLVCDFLVDIFNTLSKTQTHGRKFYKFRDGAMSRYQEEVDVEQPTKDGNNTTLHGITNKGMTSSTMSINNESFKSVPE